jgi:hypothetical protein
VGLYWWGVVYAGVGLPGGRQARRPLARPEVSACERCASISLFILKLRLTYRLDVSTILPVRLTCATRRPARILNVIRARTAVTLNQSGRSTATRL